MPFVSRSTDGAINGLFEQLQEGFAEEFLPDDHVEVVAFLNPPPPPYTIDADLPWARMTEDEAELVQDGIDASAAKTRNMINKAISFTEGTDAFVKFKAIIASATSTARASEIMGRPLLSELVSSEAERL
ncbi:hypothetical protein HJA87_12085 [Rhizobium bangladeshense]|uniref:Uncharacterized protein n=1 Tax=Rhizobium bangladeshense TaxID=1138189 RepID=A0ABS7LGK9_9HYPH|nr:MULTISPECIES: hypothetical protein [Rhizobium]MBX5020154.1 hypothetical protein [Rhizobium lentis]MBY3590617.1 hypothetical protein [Rhizobium bangladeshense]